MPRLLPLACLLVAILCGCERSPIATEPISQGTPAASPPNATAAPVVDVLPGDVGSKFAAKVIGVVDGDTVDVLTDDKQTIRLRLNGIDTPERGQPFGNNAKQFVSDRIFGASVRVVVLDVDRYGRSIAEVFAVDERLTLSLVAAGLAWHYVKYSDDEALAAAEVAARSNELGLWADSRHVAPWDWRKLSKEERDKLR